MNLREMLAAECAACPNVECSWVAPDDTAFAIQGVVGRKQSPDPDHRGWTRIEPVYLRPEDMRALYAIAARVLERFPEVRTSHVVGYVFHPGASWVVVYRRGVKEGKAA